MTDKINKSCANCVYVERSSNQMPWYVCRDFDTYRYDPKPDEYYTYVNADANSMAKTQRAIYNLINKRSNAIPAIKDVIFNPPATIIIWEDKTKTVVKCGENDIYDPEKGMAMAISRKALGDRGSYYNVFEKWLEKCDIDLVPAKSKIVMTPTTIEITYDHKEKDIDKCCDTCKYDDRTLDEEPCNSCTIPTYGDYAENWTPKESDEHEDALVVKTCGNCRYAKLSLTEFPCWHCRDNKYWKSKESDD